MSSNIDKIKILDEQPVTEDITNGKNIKFSGAECDNVTFSYGDEIILDNLNVEIPKGKIIGISGKSGSGKSTLLKLLMRFWNVNSGEIKISGVNVNEINTENLRNNEGFVTQDTHLFHDTIENNICIARLDATSEEIIAACKKASVHDFIMSLPNGYQTQVGELGETLSGGERQRIGLARWFKNTNIYKNNLESFVNGQGMTWKTKIKIMITVTVLMTIGFIMMNQVIVGRIVLIGVWVFHILYFIFGVKTIKNTDR